MRPCVRGLVAQGFYEVITLPLGPADGAESVRLLNPLAADDAWLRRRLLPGLVRLVEANWANHVPDIRLFEIGTAFAAAPAGERPHEEHRVAAVLTGRREPAHWSGSGEARFDIWDLKGRLDAAVALAIPGAEVQVEGQAWVVRDRQGRVVGEGGPLAADAPAWAGPLFGFELLIDPAPRRPAPFAPLPTTPSSERVLALLLPEGVQVRQVDALLRRVGGDLLVQVAVESDYRGAGAPGGHAERRVPADVPRGGPHAARQRGRRGGGAAPGRAGAGAGDPSGGTAGPAPEGERGQHL